MDKRVLSIKNAIEKCGIRDGMTVSFHHHLRSGDYVMNMVLDEIAAMGIKGITVNCSGVFDTYESLLKCMKNGTITSLETTYISGGIGAEISNGILDKPVVFRTHGGRSADIVSGKSKIDIAFVAASASDCCGNSSGLYGENACGGLGYSVTDAEFADKTVVITDNLMEYPLVNASISEEWVDYVVTVDKIGDPAGIVSGTLRITHSPVRLGIADTAVECIKASGLLVDGFSLLAGAGGVSLAATSKIKDLMIREGIVGSQCTGGMTTQNVEMLEAGCFRALMDAQCFDSRAIQSMRDNPNHCEISAAHYASPGVKSATVDSLDVAILGATEVDLDFNVNVHTDSYGKIMGGSGGHSDAAAGCKMTVIIGPAIRHRIPLIRERVACISTPGNTVDVLVTQYGVAVNPNRGDLDKAFRDAGINVKSIRELYDEILRLTGKPNYSYTRSGKEVAKILYRTGEKIDSIFCNGK